MKPQDANAETIAATFSRLLRAMIGPENMAEVIALNATEPNPRICHSHDYCDANVAMGDAMDLHRIDGFDAEGSVTDAFCDLWNWTWEIARQTGFRPDA